ncbi:MAG: HAD family hydrolase [Chloracidobacterium sp.]|nr:HAD family hydrolase [Chloracidobacterium sp.]MCC6826335.1 HAD family hydrolase [Acidobacteriota bacterium]MCO5333083.1 HAD family hydrolase [Pyrinomonadaceae bacterium]
MKKPAIFLDRDGTLIEEVNFLHRVEDLRIFEQTPKALGDLRDAGFLIVVLTNQSGIGRGRYSVEDMHAVHRAMQDALSGMIDGFYFCPHLPDAGCRCRKPGLGMIEAACEDLAIDLELSWMIGDKRSDIETGFAANIRTALVLTGYGAEDRKRLDAEPTVTADGLGDAAEAVLRLIGRS